MSGVRVPAPPHYKKINIIHPLDFIIILTFICSICIYGIYSSNKNQTIDHYFLGNKNTPWWVAMFSIVATETSVLTFISIPGLAYRSDWFFLQLAIGYIIGRILVSIFLLPQYFQGNIVSIYEVIGKRFGSIVQKIASGIFIITRLFADGVRFLATAVIVEVITGWPIWIAVLIIGLVTMVYSLVGGIRTIVWVDAFQFILYFFSGILIIVFIINSNNFDGWNDIVDNGKLNIFNLQTENFFLDAWFFVSAILGGALLSFASHGSDYMMVQRVLTCKNLFAARMAMIGSGIFVFIQFMIFLMAGSLIWSYLGGISLEKDRELASFIVKYLPTGLKGILLAGVLSAAMSTLSSSINSLAASTIHDWMKAKINIYKTIIISGFWAFLLILISLVFDEGDSAIIVIGFKIASFTYGGLLSLFILSRSKIIFKTLFLVIGLISSISIVFVLEFYGIAWTWYILVSVITNITIVYFLHFSYNFIKRPIQLCIFIVFISSYLFGYKSGLDVLYAEDFKHIQGKNIGVLVNHTSVNSDGKHLISLFNNAKLNIIAIFSPEHGFKGVVEAGKNISNDTYSDFNIPIYSLYGENNRPTIKMLEGIEVIIVDLQDIGVRYYTYISTLTMVMDAASELNIPIIILDRLNPLGKDIRGPLLNLHYSSFVGMHPIPIQHGMTIGELGNMINNEGWLASGKSIALDIVKYEGKIIEINNVNVFTPRPSPNMPDLETARNYTGLCLIEGTNISEGRGTDLPFKVIGAPWIDSERLINAMKKYLNKSDIMDTISFIPRELIGKSSFPKYKDKICKGIRIWKIEDPIYWTVYLFKVINELYPSNFKFLESNFIDKLYGSNALKDVIYKGGDITKLINKWKKDEEFFYKLRDSYIMYE